MQLALGFLVSKNGRAIYYLLVRCRIKIGNSVNYER